MKQRLLALAVGVLVPLAARAADLPVSYSVEQTPLKPVLAGTSLTFELYNDAACTALVQSTPVAIENVTLILKLKQHTPKNDVKLPNTLELRTTLANAVSATALYLEVTGPPGMVVPVGGACQAQAASGALPRTVFVPADGNPVENGDALLAIAAGLTGNPARPHTLQLDDGEYDVGGTTLVLSGVVLQGRSAERTIVQGTGSATFSPTQGGVVRTDSDVRNLTVKNIGGGATFAGGIVFVGTVGRIEDVVVDVSNAANSYGVWNRLGNVAVRNARVTTSATADSVALLHDDGGLGASSRVLDSKIVATSSTDGEAEGVRSTGGNLRVRGGTVFGETYANGMATVVFRGTALSGAASGSVQCYATSTATGFFANTCPAELWNTNAE